MTLKDETEPENPTANSARNPSVGRIIAALLVMYWAALLVATHLPGSGGGLPPLIWDKALHAGAFTGLTFLLLLAWNWGRPATLVNYATVLLLVAGYGALDELTQLLVPLRNADVWDWVADVIGAIGGAVFYALIRFVNVGVSKRFFS